MKKGFGISFLKSSLEILYWVRVDLSLWFYVFFLFRWHCVKHPLNILLFLSYFFIPFLLIRIYKPLREEAEFHSLDCDCPCMITKIGTWTLEYTRKCSPFLNGLGTGNLTLNTPCSLVASKKNVYKSPYLRIYIIPFWNSNEGYKIPVSEELNDNGYGLVLNRLPVSGIHEYAGIVQYNCVTFFQVSINNTIYKNRVTS